MQVVVPIHMKDFTGTFLHGNSEEEPTEIKVRAPAELVFEGGTDMLIHASDTLLVEFLCIKEMCTGGVSKPSY
jgi:hypothetical protein